MPHLTSGGYALPISLCDLVDTLGIDRLKSIVDGLSGAMALTPKGNECWRYALAGCMVLGYCSSATVTGEHTAQLRALEMRIRVAAQCELRVVVRIRAAVQAALDFVTYHISDITQPDTTEPAVIRLLECWMELNAAEQERAYGQFGQEITHPQMRECFVRIVRSVVVAYGQGINDALLWDEPNTVPGSDRVRPTASMPLSLQPIPVPTA